MKKQIIFKLLLILTISCYSQNLEKIEQSEVLFILHEGTNRNYQSKRISQKYKDKRSSISYNFVFKEENYYSKNEEIKFTFRHYYDYDEQFKNNPVPYFKLNKSFLKKNRNIIITGEFMRKIGYVKSVKLINNAKTIFLIDKTEIQDKEIVVKKVRHSYDAKE